jgi:hypothetical protein
MGTTGDFESLGNGPDGGYEGAQAFQAGTQYTLEFTVARIGVNTVTVTASIAGGGTNWTWSVTDTNYAYHRFDSFAIRPNSLETSADRFTFPEFKVEVIEAEIPLAPFLSEIGLLTPGTVRLTWDSIPGVNYHVLSTAALGGTWTTNTTLQATEAITSYTNAPGTDVRFYQILAEP